MLSTAGRQSKGLGWVIPTVGSKTHITRARSTIFRQKGRSGETIACSTVDEFVRSMV